jgi:hypothetical protein
MQREHENKTSTCPTLGLGSLISLPVDGSDKLDVPFSCSPSFSRNCAYYNPGRKHHFQSRSTKLNVAIRGNGTTISVEGPDPVAILCASDKDWESFSITYLVDDLLGLTLREFHRQHLVVKVMGKSAVLGAKVGSILLGVNDKSVVGLRHHDMLCTISSACWPKTLHFRILREYLSAQQQKMSNCCDCDGDTRHTVRDSFTCSQLDQNLNKVAGGVSMPERQNQSQAQAQTLPQTHPNAHTCTQPQNQQLPRLHPHRPQHRTITFVGTGALGFTATTSLFINSDSEAIYTDHEAQGQLSTMLGVTSSASETIHMGIQVLEVINGSQVCLMPPCQPTLRVFHNT